tara:strand:- start:10058 stop:16126 length:6069 start_codon:yes stop_codon:yes gene_type:complete
MADYREILEAESRQRGTPGLIQSNPDLPFLSLDVNKHPADLATEALTRPQRSNLRGAQTDIGRGIEQARQSPDFASLFQEEIERDEPTTFETLTTPLFDMLQIGQFTTVGFIQEMLDSGDTSKAFKQAAVELYNALPGFEHKEATRPGWADVLKDQNLFGDETAGRWGRAGLGFILDVALDPLTYTGFGLAKAIRAGREAGGSIKAVSAIEDVFPWAGKAGEAFLPNYRLKQFGIDNKKQDDVEALLSLRRQSASEEREGLIKVSEAIKGISYDMKPEEKRIIQLFFEQGDDKIEAGLAKYFTEMGVPQADKRIAVSMGKVEEMRQTFKNWWDIEAKEGLVDKNMFDEHYMPLRAPQTKRSWRGWRNFAEDRGVLQRTKPVEGDVVRVGPRGALEGNYDATFSHHRNYKTLQQRLQAGEPTELEFDLNMLRRGMEHERAVASKRFMRTVMDDSNLVRRIDKKEAAKSWLGNSKVAQANRREWENKGYVLFDAKKFKEMGASEIDGADVITTLSTDKHGLYMMPKPLADDMFKLNQSMSDGGVSDKMWKFMQEAQGAWKGWALFSGGYHMRNLYSNLQQNWLADVVDPRWYARAMAVQAGGTEKLDIVRRGIVEGLIGKKTMDDVFFTMKDKNATQVTGHMLEEMSKKHDVYNSGMFTRDMPENLEREILTNFDKVGRRSMMSSLSVGGKGFERLLIDSGRTPEEATNLARVNDIMGHTWAYHNKSTIAEYWRGQHWRYEKKAGDVESGDDIMFQLEDIKYRAPNFDEVLIPHGDVEEVLSPVYKKARIEGRDVTGAEIAIALKKAGLDRDGLPKDEAGNIAPMDEATILEAMDWGLKRGSATWYEDFSQGIEAAVGRPNMNEASSVFAIMSKQNNPEDNLADTYSIMDIARRYISETSEGKMSLDESSFRTALTALTVKRSGPVGRVPLALRREMNPGKLVQKVDGPQLKQMVINKYDVNSLVKLYKDATFTGDMKTLNYAMQISHRGSNPFNPFGVLDVHMARFFGRGKYKTVKKGGKRRKNEDGSVDILAEEGDKFLVSQYGRNKGRYDYRVDQYMVANAARKRGISVDEAQAAIWFFTRKHQSPRSFGADYSHLGGTAWVDMVGRSGSWKSAERYAQHTKKELEGVIDKTTGLPGFNRLQRAMDTQDLSPLSETFAKSIRQVLFDEERIIPLATRAGDSALWNPSHSGLAVEPGVSWNQLEEFNEKLFSKLDDGAGKLKVLTEKHADTGMSLEEELGFTHSVVKDAASSYDGKLEPNYAIHINTRDPEVADGIAALLADGLKQDSARWTAARRYTDVELAALEGRMRISDLGLNAEELAGMKPRLAKKSVADSFLKEAGRKATKKEVRDLMQGQEIALAGVAPKEAVRFVKKNGKAMNREEFTSLSEIAGKRGLDLVLEPQNQGVRIANFTDDTPRDFFSKVNDIQKESQDITGPLTGETYHHVGGYHERAERGYEKAVSQLRLGVSRGPAGPSDLSGRIYDSLHKQFEETHGEFQERYGWQRLAEEPGEAGGRAGIIERALEIKPADKSVPLYQSTEKLTARAKGMVQFQEDGKAIVDLLEKSDVSTVIHEMGHIARRQLIDGDDLVLMEKHFKVENGIWDEVAEEKFASAWEKHFYEGKSKAKVLDSAFGKIRDWMQSIYGSIVGTRMNVTINDGVRDVFDRVLGKGVFDLSEDEVKYVEDLVNAHTGAANAGELLAMAGSKVERAVGTSSPLLRLNRYVGGAIENNSKIAHLAAVAERSGSWDVASKSTRKYLFDYGELTDFERKWMRNILPFYTWTRKNIPLQITAMVEDPGKYAKIPKTIQNIESITPEWSDISTPDYFKELHAVRMPALMEGKPIYLNPNLPFQDLNRMNHQEILASMTPFVKLLGEYFPTNAQSYFTDRPIERYRGEPSDLVPGMEKRAEHLLQSLLPPVGKAARALKAAGGRKVLPEFLGGVEGEEVQTGKMSLQMISEVLGIRGMQNDVRRTMRGQTYALREALTRARKKARDVGVDLPSTKRRRRGRRGRSGRRGRGSS